jgi:hypothetical protein
VSPPPTRKRSMRAACSRGTRAASLTLPMRRPLRSSTGMDSSSVKYKRLSAIENAPAPDSSSTNPDGPTCLLHLCSTQLSVANSNMAHRLGKSQAKKAIIFGLLQEGAGDPARYSTTGTSPDSIMRWSEVTSFGAGGPARSRRWRGPPDPAKRPGRRPRWRRRRSAGAGKMPGWNSSPGKTLREAQLGPAFRARKKGDLQGGSWR